MAKFMVLYYSEMSASQLMANAIMEQMKASMAEWQKWKDGASKTAKIEFGMPLETWKHITLEGTSASDSKVGGYSIMEGRSKEAVGGSCADASAFEEGGGVDWYAGDDCDAGGCEVNLRKVKTCLVERVCIQRRGAEGAEKI